MSTTKIALTHPSLHYYDSYRTKALGYAACVAWAEQLTTLMRLRENLCFDLRVTDGRSHEAKALMRQIDAANEKLRQHMAKVQP